MPQKAPQKVPRPADRSVAIILIGIFKLLKAILLIFVSITAFHLVNKDLGETFEHWARELGLRPGNHFVQTAVSHALNITARKLELFGVITLIYAGLFGTEGVGLLMGKRWAEYMTIITTSGLMPVEFYEIVKHVNGFKIATLVINAAAVAYLVIRLWKPTEGKPPEGKSSEGKLPKTNGTPDAAPSAAPNPHAAPRESKRQTFPHVQYPNTCISAMLP